MINDGTGKDGGIKFATHENTMKFYWVNRGNITLDYPAVFIGTMTPNTFKWTKKAHLFDVIDESRINPNAEVIKCGSDLYSPIEFLGMLNEIKYWSFDMQIAPMKKPAS